MGTLAGDKSDDTATTWIDPTPVNYVTQAGFGDETNEIGFSIERSTDGGATFFQIGTAVANATSFTETQVFPATTYSYRVSAFNASGSAGTTCGRISTTG